MGQTPKQVSRFWLQRYGRQRTADGKFAPGYHLFTRPDGQSRWIWAPGTDDAIAWQHQWLSDEGRRVLTHLLVIVVAAFLWFWL